MDNYYTTQEVASKLKVQEQTIVNYIKDGKLKAVELGKGYRISEAELLKFLTAAQPINSGEDYFERSGYNSKFKAFRKTIMKPASPLAQPIPRERLEEYLSVASVDNREGYRAFPFPALSIMAEDKKRLPIGLVLEKEISFAGTLFFFAFASPTGEILTAESLWEDAETSRLQNSVGLLSCIGTIYRGLVFIPRYYSQIPYEGEVKFAFILDRPLNRVLAMDSERSRFWRSGHYKATSEEPIIIERSVSTSSSMEDVKKMTLTMVKEFLWYFNCDLGDEIISNVINEVSQNTVSELPKT